jgi:hypothetical protein
LKTARALLRLDEIRLTKISVDLSGRIHKVGIKMLARPLRVNRFVSQDIGIIQ